MHKQVITQKCHKIALTEMKR